MISERIYRTALLILLTLGIGYVLMLLSVPTWLVMALMLSVVFVPARPTVCTPAVDPAERIRRSARSVPAVLAWGMLAVVSMMLGIYLMDHLPTFRLLVLALLLRMVIPQVRKRVDEMIGRSR
jgi:hypothetical protein